MHIFSMSRPHLLWLMWQLGDTGRILVRESGTEPVVRVMVEAESEEICQKYVDMVVNVIKENGYVAG